MKETYIRKYYNYVRLDIVAMFFYYTQQSKIFILDSQKRFNKNNLSLIRIVLEKVIFKMNTVIYNINH